MRLTTSAVFLLAVLLFAPGGTLAERRVALVIGNGAYAHASRLANPANDAGDMAASLERLGFEITLGLDLDEPRFSDLVLAFSNKLAGAGVALLFYAGHGIQYQGRNYLVPVDARLGNEFRLKRETIALDDIIEQMEAQVALNLVFLDACRNNPLAENLRRSIRGARRSAIIARGLARVDSRGTDTLIAFAAAPGKEAADGSGRNSPFAGALLRHIATPGVEIEVLLKRVTADVRASTRGLQAPERLSSLAREFYFRPRAAADARPTAPAGPAGPKADSAAVEVAFWNSIADCASADDFRLYLRRFPNGHFRDLAERRIATLKTAPAKRPEPRHAAAPPLVQIASFVRGDYLGNSFRHSDIRRLYGARVLYDGKDMAAEALVTDKLSYARRWPSRLYRLTESTLSVTPVPDAAASYSVSFQYDFSVTRPGKTVSGVGQTFLVLEIVDGRPLIRSERHKTLERR